MVLLGCGPKEPFPVSVSGVVKLEGKPLVAGRISFITPGKVPEILEIVDGRFSGKVMTGERRVEIAAYRPYQIPADIPKSMHALMKDGKENYLPEKYSRNSELTANVKDMGNNEFTFDLAP